ncbi:DUF4240 domain-containing protein [Homoserinibacter sp. GY 40078]|uniref:DUF4240 domain-containing protein n=1 Tax=Homoserinibacter sp. GY 40078 TaxID=2603275 RepID=UPI0011C85AA6|nr:DUF4240 domain-containing protein [Homoserinibacter sp. GY 40078]TXK18579.1 DUF4240 domain-containing protein [Homoserinibacter sp. GY 40078]
MNQNRFFELIDQARDGRSPQDPSADAGALGGVLEDLSDDELISFRAEYRRQLVRLGTWDVWAAGFVAQGGMGDDSFHYFRSWLIGKGADAVEQAARDPHGLVAYFDTTELENEELEYVVLDLLEERELEFSDDGPDPDAEPEGQPFEEDEAYSRYPAIAAWAEMNL